jgi:uncharacterized protein YjcR
VRGTDPPACSAHAGRSFGAGAPRRNQNARTHGFYAQEPDAVTIEQAIAGLVDKMTRIDGLIEAATANGSQPHDRVIRLFEIYTKASSRLSRLLRDKRDLSGEADDSINEAIAAALDELSEEWGIDL